MNISELDWPRCYVCDLPVDEFSGTSQDDGTLILVAACHGEYETVVVPYGVLKEGTYFEVGLAFLPKH